MELLGADLAKGKDGGDAVSRAQRLEDFVRGAAQHAQVLPHRRKRGAEVLEALVQELAANRARLGKAGERQRLEPERVEDEHVQHGERLRVRQ